MKIHSESASDSINYMGIKEYIKSLPEHPQYPVYENEVTMKTVVNLLLR